MAQVTSGSFSTNQYQGSTGKKGLIFEWTRTSTNIESNYSTIHWTLKGAGTGSTYHELRNAYLNINGSRVYTQPSGKINLYVGTKVAEGDTNIPHENDGSKTFSADGGGGVYTSAVNCTGSGSWELESIPRASTFTLSGGTLGSTISVAITRASSSFTHKVYCKLGNRSQTISNNAGTSASATLSMDFANGITTGNSSGVAQATATMYVETYSGSTLIGTKTATFTMVVPTSVVPTISSVTKTDTTGYLSTHGAYVQGKSNLRIQTSSSGAYSSTISSITINIKNSGGSVLRTLTGSDVTLSGITYTGTLTIQVIVKDSRNRTATNSSTIVVAAYENPKITTFTTERRNNDASVTITYNASITNVNNHNSNGKTFKIYKRQKGTSSWGTAIATYTSGYTYNGSTTTSCDENYGWEFKLEAIDSFTTTTKTAEVGTAFELLNWKADGTAMAIGKVSETSNTFEVALNTQLGGTLSVAGNTTIGGTTTSNDYSGKIWGRTNDLATNNTSDTWIPVMVSGKWQHRVLPTTYNSTAPTLTGLTLNGDSGTNNVVKSGVIENQTSFESDTFKKQSFAGSTNVSGTWYNIINIRHRNGGGDGNSYGMQIRKLLTSNGPLEIRTQLASTTWTGWQRIPVEFVLYDNATGTNGNVTLSETADHFTYLEIFFRVTNADGSYNSQKIYLPNGKSTTLSIVHNYYTNNIAYSYLFSKRISISGTTITSERNDYTQFRGTAINEHSTANNIYIVRVIGIR